VVTIPVTFSIPLAAPAILVSQSGLGFTAAAQGGAPLPQPLAILNVGNEVLNWSALASTLSGGKWLQLSASSGTVVRPYRDVSQIMVSIDPTVVAGLAPGDYYGQIQISDATNSAINTPQLVTVILTVQDAGTDPGPQVTPSSLIFTGQAGLSPAPQSVTLGIRKAVADNYLSGKIGLGFDYAPVSALVQPNQPSSLQVIPDFSQANPGDINRGTITLQFSDGTVRNISLLTVVAPAPGSLAQASSSCQALNVQWREPQPPTFTAVQGQAQTLEVQVVDSCGNLVGPSNPTAASVTATLSNNDPPVTLVHISNGVWRATWKAQHSTTQPVKIVVAAFNSTGSLLQTGNASTIYGTVVPGSTPLVTAGGVQHSASQLLGVPIAPGALIALNGLNLADGQGNATGLPLPAQLNGTQVFMGTEALPLLNTDIGQVNVQVPYDVPVNTQFQVTLQKDSLQSLPEQLIVALAQPGVFTVNKIGSGPGVIFRSDGVTLAQPTSCNASDYAGCAPATAGETISIQCSGLGRVSPAVPAGTAPPDSPISTTDNPVSVTIGGLDGLATNGTLIPGRPGVYQVLATVPAGVSGDQIPVVVTVAGQSSPPVTMAVQ
jgi:uncharacterized protein (TIGR03437 family)